MVLVGAALQLRPYVGGIRTTATRYVRTAAAVVVRTGEKCGVFTYERAHHQLHPNDHVTLPDVPVDIG